MQFRELAVSPAVEFIPPAFTDHRGLFTTPFQEAAFTEALGHSLHVAQTNHSVSATGTIRGIHFADTPPGQAKYLYCPRGAILDVVVDVRHGSPSFGRWDAVRLDSVEFRAVYVAEGIGHAFIALEEGTVVSYLCTAAYNPGAEHGVNPLDPELALPWPTELSPILSEKDSTAPTLKEAAAAGLLPRYQDCLVRYEQLRASWTGSLFG